MRISTSRVALSMIVLLTACSGGGLKREVQSGSDVLDYLMPGKKVVDPDHGAELWLGVGPIAGEGKTPANGVVQLHYMEDGTTLLSSQLNIGLPAKGYEYRAWLVSPDGERVDAGTFDSLLGDVRHKLNYQAKRDLRSFTELQVTLQKAGTTTPGALQAKGTLKERQRGN